VFASIALGTLMGASLYKWLTERFGWLATAAWASRFVLSSKENTLIHIRQSGLSLSLLVDPKRCFAAYGMPLYWVGFR
jgi:hypothetical protein